MVFDAVANHESRMLSMALFEARIVRNPGETVAPAAETGEANPYASFDTLPTIKESMSFLILDAMRRAEGNQSIAARLLGISRTALNKRLNLDTEQGH